MAAKVLYVYDRSVVSYLQILMKVYLEINMKEIFEHTKYKTSSFLECAPSESHKSFHPIYKTLREKDRYVTDSESDNN